MVRERRASFTLTELLIVVGILIVLMVSFFGFIANPLKKARDLKREIDMEKISAAFLLWINEKGALPSTVSYGEQSPGGWDYSSQDINGNGIYFLDFLVQDGYLPARVVDPLNNGTGDVWYGGTGYAYGYYNYGGQDGITLCYKSEMTNQVKCKYSHSDL